MMYDDLIKRLREFNAPCTLTIMQEAADAIEELSRAQKQWIEQERKALLKAQPKWIPVTERLPEDDTAVLAHVYWTEYGDTMICYGHWHKGRYHLFNHIEGRLISGYVVTRWMPLPEPPEEET